MIYCILFGFLCGAVYWRISDPNRKPYIAPKGCWDHNAYLGKNDFGKDKYGSKWIEEK